MIMMIGNAENRDSADIAGGNDAVGAQRCHVRLAGGRTPSAAAACVLIAHSLFRLLFDNSIKISDESSIN